MGLDALEIPLFEPTQLAATEIRSVFAAEDMECTVCAILPEGINPISPDAAVRARSIEHLKACVVATAACGILKRRARWSGFTNRWSARAAGRARKSGWSKTGWTTSVTSTTMFAPMRLWVCVLQPVFGGPARGRMIAPPKAWDYGAGAELRKVGVQGHIYIGDQRWRMSQTLASHTVWLERIDQRVLVYFCRTLVQEIDLSGKRPIAVERSSLNC
jgi:hypothetical protein